MKFPFFFFFLIRVILGLGSGYTIYEWVCVSCGDYEKKDLRDKIGY